MFFFVVLHCNHLSEKGCIRQAFGMFIDVLPVKPLSLFGWPLGAGNDCFFLVLTLCHGTCFVPKSKKELKVSVFKDSTTI